MFDVPDSYHHYPKLVAPNDDLILGNAHLKWYDIHRAESEITEALQKEARDFLRADPALDIDGDLGFVILHLASALLLAASLFFVIAFIVEPGFADLDRPWTRLGVYATFGAILLEVAAVSYFRRVDSQEEP